MSLSFFNFIRDQLRGEPPLNPVDHQMAKRWVKERLKRMFPELRGNPKKLEEAYQSLSIEPHEGSGKGGATMYEVVLPEKN